jgi:hypothetical protein
MELENVSQSLGANSEISLLFLRSVLLCAWDQFFKKSKKELNQHDEDSIDKSRNQNKWAVITFLKNWSFIFYRVLLATCWHSYLTVNSRGNYLLETCWNVVQLAFTEKLSKVLALSTFR